MKHIGCDDMSKVLRCNVCGDEIDVCDECFKDFKVGQSIICYEDGDYHFCSEECMKAFLNNNITEAKAYLDDDE